MSESYVYPSGRPWNVIVIVDGVWDFEPTSLPSTGYRVLFAWG
jgi:hypothetical protein